MEMDPRAALSAAVVRLLTPLVRVLLRHGMAFADFAELAKRTYVQVAAKDFALPGKRQTDSRISVLTGLTRKDVARLQAEDLASDAALAAERNRAARVLNAWVLQRKAVDGTPAPLTMEQFAELVRESSGDMPARAVLDELLAVGAVVRGEDGALKLMTLDYRPGADGADPRNLLLLGEHARDLISAIDHNLTHSAEERFIQRRIYFDNIPVSEVARIRQALRTYGEALIAQSREVMAPADQGDDTDAPGRTRVVIGVHYFEEPVEPAREAAPTERSP
jgi:hypothetical protein